MAPITLKQMLKDFVQHHISLDEDRRRDNCATMKKILSQLIEKMKATDPLFKEIFNTVYYAGSYFENLKVGDTDEFDLNILLNLPFKESEITIDNDGLDGFAQYKLKQPLETLLMNHPKFETLKKLTEFFDTQTRTVLSLNKINNWMKKVVDTAMNAVTDDPNADHSVTVTRSTSGPATTLNMVTKDNAKIDVDLVPVIPLSVNAMRSLTNNKEFVDSLPDTKKQCFMVPKPPTLERLSNLATDSNAKLNQQFKATTLNSQPKGGISPTKTNTNITPPAKPLIGYSGGASQGIGGGDRSPNSPQPSAARPPLLTAKSVLEERQDTYFRVSMPDAERHLIKDKRCAKTLIRIFKAMRDNENWSFIASYHIKTMFLWKLSEHPETLYWDEGRMDELFISMLKEFRDRVEQRYLPHILFPEYNLFAQLKETQAKGVKGRLDAIIAMAEAANVEKLLKIFPGKPSE